VTLQVVVAVWPGATVANVAGEVAWADQPSGVVRLIVTAVSGALLGLGSVVVAVRVEPGWTMLGACSVNGCLTTIGVLPVTPFTVTLIVAVPAAMVRTAPVRLTAATAGLLLA
jgi:hypothetical protein